MKAQKSLLRRERLPKFHAPELTVQTLIREGNRLADEQQQVLDHKLSEEYMKDTNAGGGGLIGLSG